MATISITYKGLVQINQTISVSDGITIDGLIAAIAADEGLATEYYKISVEDNPAVNDVAYGDSSSTLASIGIVDGTSIICTTNQSGSKQERQIQKLAIAAVKRAATSRTSTYDVNKLPNPYNGNLADPNDGASTLDPGRPWS